MISIFPEPYHDELMYSVFARYYLKSGYATFIDVAEELYQRPTVRPDTEFLNPLTIETIKRLTAIKPIEDIIIQHTMYPHYARFMDRQKRLKALEALVRMDTSYRNLLSMRVSDKGNIRFMRYCPLCADKDREAYGETYWHRSHQLVGVKICPRHDCFLINSNIKISGKASPNLVNAEMEVPLKSDVKINENKIDSHLAEYIGEIFKAPMDFENDIFIGKYLHYKMSGTIYRSVRGEQRNIQLLYDDFMDFYKNSHMGGLSELWQIQKVLTGYRKNSFEVAQLAMFLNITVKDLLHPVLPEKTQEQIFDERVNRMNKAGISYPDIAKLLGASINVVKPIGEALYKKYRVQPKNPEKSGVKVNDWKRIDRELLSQVKVLAEKLYGTKTDRPHKVTAVKVCRIMNLPEGYLNHLPLCMDAVRQYAESQEEYWAREVVWAACQVLNCNEKLIWRRIRDLTNLRRENYESSLPFINKYADEELAELIKHLF